MIKLSDIFKSYNDYETKVLNVIKLNYVGAEWLNDAVNYTKQESLYNLLMLKYGDRYIRYDNVDIFINKLIFDLTDILPDIFAKQQVFIKNKLAEFLSDERNRAIVVDSNSKNTRDSNSNSKVGNSASPLNLVINTADEILNAPITSSNLSNIKLLENYDGKSNQVNYNFVNDLIKTLDADYSLRISEFMSFLSKHFVNVVGSYYKGNSCCNNTSIKGDSVTFNNGYKVNEVNYYGEENKQAIQDLSGKVESNLTSIQVLNSKVVDLENEIKDIDVVGLKNDVENIKQEQKIQNEGIQINKNDIQGLKENDILLKKELTNISDELNNINDSVNKNISDIKTLRNDLGDLGDVVNENTNKINNKQDKLTFSGDFEVNDNNVELSDLFISRVNNLESQIQSLTSIVNNQTFLIKNLQNNLDLKQDKLIAGDNIIISDNTISASQPSLSGYATQSWVRSNYYSKNDLTNYSISLKLSSDTKIGNSDNHCLWISTYSNYQTYIKFVSPVGNTGEGKIIGPNDQIFRAYRGGSWGNN